MLLAPGQGSTGDPERANPEQPGDKCAQPRAREPEIRIRPPLPPKYSFLRVFGAPLLSLPPSLLLFPVLPLLFPLFLLLLPLPSLLLSVPWFRCFGCFFRRRPLLFPAPPPLFPPQFLLLFCFGAPAAVL